MVEVRQPAPLVDDVIQPPVETGSQYVPGIPTWTWGAMTRTWGDADPHLREYLGYDEVGRDPMFAWQLQCKPARRGQNADSNRSTEHDHGKEMVPLSAWTRRAVATAVTGLAILGGILIAATSPALAAGSSQVSVVHGIPGQPVDVYVNGSKTLSNFAPGTVAGPLDLAAGSYDIALTKPGEPVSNAILTVNDVAVPGGKNLSLVAHLNAAGKPALTAVVNDTSPIPAGKARLVVRHTAAAPAVDVRANGTPVFSGLTNPNQAQADVAAGSVSADVVLAGTSTVVIGPATLNLAEGSSTIVYAIGSAEQKTLALVVQTISGLASAPSGVPAGTGGLADPGHTGPWSVLVAAGALLIAGGAAHLVHIRRQQRATAPGR